MRVDTSIHSPGVKAELEELLQRSERYRSKRGRPSNSSELAMVHGAQVRYERLLVATSDDSTVSALAMTYVDRLRPCYEWEGGHDCPEREAAFAHEYQTAHPGGPFSGYLPLLEAHRWLCTAEGYESEKRPEDAARSRREYQQAISRPGDQVPFWSGLRLKDWRCVGDVLPSVEGRPERDDNVSSLDGADWDGAQL